MYKLKTIIKLFIFTIIVLPLASRAELSLSTVSLKQIETMKRNNSLPLLITQYKNTKLSNLFISLQNITTEKPNKTLKNTLTIINDISSQTYCDEPMALSLAFKYIVISKEMNAEFSTKAKEKVLSHLNKQCKTYLLYVALESQNKNKIDNMYRYIESLIKNNTNLAETIKHKKYVNDHIKELASKYFDNLSFKGLLQTYLLSTFITNKTFITDKKSFALALFILADFYREQDNEFYYRMVTWTVISELQSRNLIPEYIARVNSDIYYK